MSHPVIKEGYLHKKTSYFTLWNKRYFKLTGEDLSYYSDPSATCRGKYPITNATITKRNDDGHVFEVRTADGQVIIMQAKNTLECQAWFACISSAIQQTRPSNAQLTLQTQQSVQPAQSQRVMIRCPSCYNVVSPPAGATQVCPMI